MVPGSLRWKEKPFRSVAVTHLMTVIVTWSGELCVTKKKRISDHSSHFCLTSVREAFGATCAIFTTALAGGCWLSASEKWTLVQATWRGGGLTKVKKMDELVDLRGELVNRT